ncbi:pentapeptide repeat-containing protein [Galbibacter sp. PAP.153]|uniref:pentapeptide repeat-containing protein n=1 Tax=Galbibacter sp. PAP.153 TaxID=3104623 RepID=UPI00300A30EA
MYDRFFGDNEYKGQNFQQAALEKGEYDNCPFYNCNFKQSDITNVSFTECSFHDCDFSMANIKNSAFKEVHFYNCKLMGLHFDTCNPFLLSFNFEDCILNFSSFYKLKLKKMLFKKCSMEQVDFTETDLTECVLDNCNLENAIFHNTVLRAADLSTSYNMTIDPEINQLQKAKFSTKGALSLLKKYNIKIEL